MTALLQHPLVQSGAGLVLGYLIASLAESFFHKNVHHASARVLRFCRRMRVGRSIVDAHYGHSVVHHGRTFRRSHVMQFADHLEQHEVDCSLLSLPQGRRVIKERYGTSVSTFGVLLFMSPVLPVYAVVLWCVPFWMALGVLVPAIAYPCASKFLHPYLHMKHADALRRAGPLMRMFLQTRYARFIAMHHFVHHRRWDCNFNLLWLGDYLLGVHRAPDDKELREMRRVGLIE